MGLISDEKYREISALLEGGGLTEPSASDAPPASTPADDVKAQESEVSPETEEKDAGDSAEEAKGAAPAEDSTSAADAKAKVANAEAAAGKSEAVSEDSGDDGDPDDEQTVPGHRVPYKRFKSVVDARNQYRDESKSHQDRLKAQQAQLEEMQKQLQALQQLRSAPPAAAPEAREDREPSYLDSLDAAGDVPPEVHKQLKELQTRVQQAERQREYDRLKVELDQEVKRHSDMNPNDLRQVLLHAVARDPSVSLARVAEQYSSWVAQMEEAAIARHLQKNPSATPEEAKEATGDKPSAPPRVRRAGGGAAGTTGAGNKKAYGSIKEGTSALMKALKDGSVNLFG